jgi:hypothetical protein
MPDYIEPHVARLIRKKTLKRVGNDTKRYEDILLSSPPKQLTSTRKSVKILADHFFKRGKSVNLAIFKFIPTVKSPKKRAASIGVWSIEKETLYAIAIVILGFPTPKTQVLFAVRIRDHAIERVSERLNTLDDIIIRDELATAACSIILSMGRWDSGEFYAKTLHGVALVRKFEDGTTVLTTWISNEMLKDNQIKNDWEPYSSSKKAIIESASGETIYCLQEQTPGLCKPSEAAMRQDK